MMKNKQLSFNVKVLILIIVVGISWIIFGLLSLNSNKKLIDYQSLQNNVNSYVNLLPSLSSAIYSIDKEIKEGNIVAKGSNKSGAITDFTNNLSEIKNQYNQIGNSQYFFFHPEQEAILIEIDKTLTEVKENFADLLGTIEERGSSNEGLFSEWEAVEQELESKIFNVSNPDIVSNIQQIIAYKKQYIRSGESDLINSITQLAEQVKQDIEYEQSNAEIDTVPEIAEDSFDSFDTFNASTTSILDINEILDSYTSYANKILEKDIQIGIGNESGIIYKILNKLEDVGNSITSVSEDISSDYAKIRKRNQIVLIIFWILFTLISVGIFLSLYFVLSKPLILIKNSMTSLSLGKSPEKLAIKTGGEFEEIAGNINKYSESLKEKVNFSNDLANGNINNDFSPVSEYDELGNSLVLLKQNLIKARKEEENHKIENEKRRWTNEGLAKFADILRQNNDSLDELSSVLIMNLVKYIDATQGGLFLINDDDKDNITLELKAAVAYNRKKFITKSIELGEGLVGTCAVEKKTTYLTEIPDNYLEITSGLGDASPKCILIVPLNLENEILGVIELAAFTEFENHEIEFIEKLAESIASTLTTVKINERTSELLEQSQRQAQEMAEQEEEMRQNMEELQATQEEAARRESEISSIFDAINSTSLVVEYDISGHITNINQKFLELLGAPKNDIMGMHHSDFTSKVRTENTYIDFWNTLKAGNSINNMEVIKLLNGKKLWLNQTYNPIQNTDGVAYKVLNIAVDISESKIKEQEFEKSVREMRRKSNEMDTLNEAINQAIIKCEYSTDSMILNANENFANLMGHSLEELKGKKVTQFFNTEELAVFNELWLKIANNETQKANIKRTLPNGEERWIVSTFSPVLDENGKIYKIYYLGQDITEQKQRFQLLVDANKEIDRLKELVEKK